MLGNMGNHKTTVFKCTDFNSPNPSLGLTTKTRGMEKWKLRVQPKGHIHTPRSAGECEGMSSYTPKWVPILGVGDSKDSQIFGEQFDGSKDWIEKLLKYRFEYLQHKLWSKKGRESKCQFDPRPLKVTNGFELHVCRGHATYFWKALEEGYNFALDLTSIRGLHKTL
jgi:hypothetical protein